MEGQELRGSGCLIIGEKGKLYTPDDYGSEYILLGNFEDKEVEIQRSPGHFREWVQSIGSGKPSWSNFADYAGKLTEVILLGNLAVWAGGEAREGAADVESPRLEWDKLTSRSRDDRVRLVDQAQDATWLRDVVCSWSRRQS